MANSSLDSASKYLNNLLLARGLLQDGRPIDFSATAEASNDGCRSRIINLVHELVLRRDRDAEQRESLACSIRSMRADEKQKVLDLQKLQAKNGELSRSLTTAESQYRSLKAVVQRTETQARDLKEQMMKMKSILDQVRAKCISDVRKRDVELEKLKSHLSGMQRGRREASGMKVNIINPQPTLDKNSRGAQDVNSTDWSLEKETNDFLAALVNETSTENVTLRSLIARTMDTLRDLTGIEPENNALDNAGGIPGQCRRSVKADNIVPCLELEEQMRTILSHCQSILKDPSFVPIEELQLRDEEIVKLRIGWEKMACRWKEAVTMMNNWRHKMLDGDEMDANDLSDLSFGRSIAVLPNGEPVLGRIDEELATTISNGQDDGSLRQPDLGAITNDLFDEESDLDIPPEPNPKRLATSPARRGIKLPQPPLRDVGNSRISNVTQRFPVESLSEIMDENTKPIETGFSKIPRQSAEVLESPPMSLSEKLAAVEAEARLAEAERKQNMGHKRKTKQNRVEKNRRRSTLRPDELAALLGAR